MEGKIEISKDDNVIISAIEHVTTTSAFKDNSWQVTGEYRFRKTMDKEFHSVVKDYYTERISLNSAYTLNQ